MFRQLLLCFIEIGRAKEISIGILVTWKGGVSKLPEALLGILPALKKINDDPNILPNDTLTFVWADTQCSTQHASGAAMGLLDMKVDVIIGTPCSGDCLAIAPLAAYSKVPMISYYAVSAALSNKEKYPFFARVLDSTTIYDKVIIGFLKAMEFRNSAIVYGVDSGFALGWAGTIRSNLVEAGIDIDLEIPYKTFDENHVQSLVKSGSRVLIWLDYNCERLRELLLAARDWDILEGWTWIMGSISTFCWQMGDRQAESLLTFHGLFSCTPYYYVDPADYIALDAGREDFAPFILPFTGTSSLVNALTADSQSHLQSTQGRGYEMDQIGPSDLISALLYDSILLYAHAAHSVKSMGMSIHNTSAMQTAMVKSKFLGLTGDISLDSNGDRHGSASIRGVSLNAQGDGLILTVIGRYSGNIDRFELLVPEDSLVFAGGMTAKPPGHVTACGAGFYTPNGTQECFPCLPGKFAIGIGFDRSTCDDCERGKYQSDAAQFRCMDCPAGTFMGIFGQQECQSCEIGKWTNVSGSTICKQCVGAFITKHPRSVSENDCGCAGGSHRYSTKNNDCVACGVGLDCAFGADGTLYSGDARSMRNGSETSVIPKLLEGFWSSKEDPWSVYECIGDESRCLGGEPGFCANGRTGITCALCESASHVPEKSGCTNCGSFYDAVVLTMIIVATIVISVLVHWMCSLKMEVLFERTPVLTLQLTASQLLSAMQMIAVIAGIPSDWGDPFGSLFSVVDSAIGTDYFRVACIFAAAMPASSHLLRPIWLALVLALLLVFQAFRGREMSRLTYAYGTVLIACFIPICSTIVVPLMCDEHPNGKWTMSDSITVHCSLSDDTYRWHLIISGLLGICMTFFGAGCIYAVQKFPYHVCMLVGHSHRASTVRISKVISQTVSSDESLSLPVTESQSEAVSGREPFSGNFQPSLDFMHATQFIFFRFEPDRHWFISFFLLRGMLIAFAPVLPTSVLLMVLLQSVLACHLALVCHSRPWATPQANTLDSVMTIGIMIVLCVSGIILHNPPRETQLMAALMGTFVCSSLAIVFGIFLTRATYQEITLRRAKLIDQIRLKVSEKVENDEENDLDSLKRSMRRQDFVMSFTFSDSMHSLIASQVKEESERGGICVAFLISDEFKTIARDSLTKIGRRLEDATFYDLKDAFFYGEAALGRDIICPRDGLPGCALVDFFPRRYRRTCTHYFSWCWQYNVLSVLDSLTLWMGRANEDPELVYLSWCFFVNNQYRILFHSDAHGAENLDEHLEKRLRLVRGVVALLDAWGNAATYVKRMWTVYEHFKAREFGINLAIILPRAPTAAFIHHLQLGDAGYKAIIKDVPSIDVEKCESYSAKDEAKIKGLLSGSVGFDAVNTAVENSIRSWVGECFQKHFRQLQEVHCVHGVRALHEMYKVSIEDTNEELRNVGDYEADVSIPLSSANECVLTADNTFKSRPLIKL